ncbi:MAG: zinc dependent phospholipase C family protein [Terriglobia bacterium]
MPTTLRARGGWGFVLLLLFLFCRPPSLYSYSVLSHEALIDTVWGPVIVPLLLARFPGASAKQLREAHAYAYGGCVIQDMGYYPFGSRLFSNLTHYARGADFIKTLLGDAQDIDEYAFALGALSHYAADNTGHPLAVNLSVADLYPKLESKYGRRVTYEDDPQAHMMVEFSFDVVQIAGDGYLPRSYHNYIGFKVSNALLERAFAQTYGLSFGKLFLSEHLSIWIYEVGASEVIPRLTQILWQQKRKKILRLRPVLARHRWKYRVAPGNYQREPYARRKGRRFALRRWASRWKLHSEQAQIGLISRFVVLSIELLPKIGPLRTLDFKPPTPGTQALFISSFRTTVERYRDLLRDAGEGRLNLQDRNFDTGRVIRAGDYRLADQTYARWLNLLAAGHFASASPALRKNILAYYTNWHAPSAIEGRSRRQRKLARELAELRSSR